MYAISRLKKLHITQSYNNHLVCFIRAHATEHHSEFCTLFIILKMTPIQCHDILISSHNFVFKHKASSKLGTISVGWYQIQASVQKGNISYNSHIVSQQFHCDIYPMGIITKQHMYLWLHDCYTLKLHYRVNTCTSDTFQYLTGLTLRLSMLVVSVMFKVFFLHSIEVAYDVILFLEIKHRTFIPFGWRVCCRLGPIGNMPILHVFRVLFGAL